MALLQHIDFIHIYIPVLLSVAGMIFVAVTRLKYPVKVAFPVTLFLMTMFMTGLKLFGIPVNDWGRVLYGDGYLGTQSVYLPGGLIFAGIGLLILKYCLRLKGSLLDTLIWGLPVAGFFQRTACLLNGCCYGKVSGLPWSVQYPQHSLAWEHHLEQGMITENASASLHVHPTQAYYMLGFLLALFFLLMIRKRIRKPGILALTGFMLLGGLRLMIEFFREPDPGKWFYVSFLGMNGLQWVILVSICLAAVHLYRKRHEIGQPAIATLEHSISTFRLGGLVVFSALMIWNARSILILPEYLLLVLLVVGTLFNFIAELFRKGISRNFQLQMASVLLITILTMSQAIPDTTIVLHPDTLAKQWLSLDAGFAGGPYNRVTYNCSGTETSRQKSAYYNGYTAFAFHHRTPKGIHLQGGLKFSAMDDYTLEGPQERYTTQVLIPYFKADFKWIGFGMGYALVNDREFGSLPMSSLRIGKRDKLFFESSLMEYYPVMALPGMWQVGFGYGFGQIDQNLFRFGLTSVEGKLVGYLGGRYELNKRFNISSNLSFGNTLQASLGLQYRFHLKNVGK